MRYRACGPRLFEPIPLDLTFALRNPQQLNCALNNTTRDDLRCDRSSRCFRQLCLSSEHEPYADQGYYEYKGIDAATDYQRGWQGVL